MFGQGSGDDTSLSYVNGTLYLGYWATNGQLHAETRNPATGQWSEMPVPGQQSVSPVTVTGMFSEPVLLFGQGFASGQTGALAWVDQTDGILFALAGWSGTYNGLFTREMTTPVT